jgi:two-component system cell cycle sensor histidine kinase/response regulator CckA
MRKGCGAERTRTSSRGYTVLEAGNGVEAIEAFARHGRADLVVSDVVMPEMDGPTLLKLRRRDPNVKIIFVSGYPRLQQEPAEPGTVRVPCQAFHTEAARR